MEHHYCSDSESIMLSTKATALLLFTIIGVSFGDPFQDRTCHNSNSASWYGSYPDYQHLINIASQYRQNPGHQNSASDMGSDDRQSYPQKPTSDGSLNNQSPSNQKPAILKPFSEMKPFEVTPDLKVVIESNDSRRPAGSGSKTYLGSITVQKDNTYNVDPNSTNIYGSITHISGSYPKSYQTSDERTVNVHGAQQLRYLQTRIDDLTNEVRNQQADLSHMQSSLDVINQFVEMIDGMVHELAEKARAQHH